MGEDTFACTLTAPNTVNDVVTFLNDRLQAAQCLGADSIIDPVVVVQQQFT